MEYVLYYTGRNLLHARSILYTQTSKQSVSGDTSTIYTFECKSYHNQPGTNKYATIQFVMRPQLNIYTLEGRRRETDFFLSFSFFFFFFFRQINPLPKKSIMFFTIHIILYYIHPMQSLTVFISDLPRTISLQIKVSGKFEMNTLRDMHQ